jgi:ubiquitin
VTGFGSTATLLGKPDVGLLSGSEMADNARRLASAVGIPLVADANLGYGNAVNVARTVAEYERAGVAGIQLEDQVSPKKCGHMAGKAIIPTAEMVGKLCPCLPRGGRGRAVRRGPDEGGGRRADRRRARRGGPAGLQLGRGRADAADRRRDDR